MKLDTLIRDGYAEALTRYISRMEDILRSTGVADAYHEDEMNRNEYRIIQRLNEASRANVWVGTQESFHLLPFNKSGEFAIRCWYSEPQLALFDANPLRLTNALRTRLASYPNGEDFLHLAEQLWTDIGMKPAVSTFLGSTAFATTTPADFCDEFGFLFELILHDRIPVASKITGKKDYNVRPEHREHLERIITTLRIRP